MIAKSDWINLPIGSNLVEQMNVSIWMLFMDWTQNVH